MVQTPADFDAVIIGAGAAGLSAGKRLQRDGLSFTILETRARIGGRAHTQIEQGFALDFGCGWLHSADRNPWTKIAAGLGLTIDQAEPDWGRQSFDAAFSGLDRAAAATASEAFFARLETADVGSGDFAADRLLEPDGRFNPMIDAISTYINGAELERVSVADWGRYADSGHNWRIVEGYGAAVAAFGAELPIRLGCAVTLIDHGGPDIIIETTQGRLTTKAALVTLPASLIASEAIAFRPALPEKTDAAAGLPLGVADKLVMTIGTADLPAGGHFFGDRTRTRTGNYELRPFGRPLIEGYFGGALARELEAGGRGAFFEFARGELSRLFGAKVAAGLGLVSETAWASDPFSRGSYSYASPGHSDQRQRLAAPVDGRLFFAGEACSKHSFSTAHGAYFTGLEAAEAIIETHRDRLAKGRAP
ncbi:flavin monoamine oxidase family protein [Methylocella silvestris]|uniref:Tryptophan 2-monooxygenase n=1 Tax=Methylocella silvestris TaxID=199596 RepID=A0A2J7TEM1_METSI|nr:NAD(P)/FAD-dependent oxidoreductase [Methylocella silvestris]PNG25215.1 amine oxidase [Methylocella silvestris]